MDTVSTAPALVVEGLRKTFESTDDEQVPVRALRGLDMQVGRGEFVAVMGPSGCGKSTLLNLIAGLESPTDGSIEVDGEAIEDLSDDRLAVMRRKHIGIVFQFFNLLEGMSVLENVSLPMVVGGRSRKQAESKALDLLDLLGIADKARKTPGVLSGGQRQRLSIARALANEPTLLLADEPTGSLDSAGGAEVLGLFRRLHDGGQTIVLVTHDDEVASSADRIVRMRDGRIDDGREPGSSPGAGSASGVFGVLGEEAPSP
jgi:putative ABC transport system ATP-binding protein